MYIAKERQKPGMLYLIFLILSFVFGLFVRFILAMRRSSQDAYLTGLRSEYGLLLDKLQELNKKKIILEEIWKRLFLYTRLVRICQKNLMITGFFQFLRRG